MDKIVKGSKTGHDYSVLFEGPDYYLLKDTDRGENKYPNVFVGKKEMFFDPNEIKVGDTVEVKNKRSRYKVLAVHKDPNGPIGDCSRHWIVYAYGGLQPQTVPYEDARKVQD